MGSEGRRDQRMYLTLGQKIVKERDVVGIFDLDTATVSKRTRDFLSRAEKNGEVELLSGDLPRSFLLLSEHKKTQEILLSPLSAATVCGRRI